MNLASLLHRRRGVLAFVVAITSATLPGQGPAAAPQATPVLVEVSVAADDGQPIPELTPAQFQLSLDGRPRRVSVAQGTPAYADKPAADGSPVTIDGVMRYRLGFEPEPSDYDGHPHQLSVTVVAAGRRFRVDAPALVRLAQPASPPSRAAPPSNTPTASDVAAWQRLWGGADVIAAAEQPAAVPSRPVETSASAADPAENVASASGEATPLDQLFARYSSGDKTIVINELRTAADFERVRPHLARTFAQWRAGAWSPDRASFALEIAIAAFARRWPNPQLFLDAARDLVTSRPDAPGVRPESDRFELCFHRVAVAMLAAVDGPHSVERYLLSIQRRVMLGTESSKAAPLRDARLVSALAMAREAQTLMLLLSVGSRRDDPRQWVVPPGDRATRRQLEEIGQLFELAAADDLAREEASVRRAFVLYRLGANPQALALLEETSSSDGVVDFWRELTHGRVLLALDRQTDAIAAFERAAMLYPDAQTPAVALMTIFLKAGERDLALGWAERARTTTENRGDPWAMYWSGYTRFLGRWLSELRDFQS
jgi:hypothetical protein